MTDYTGIGDDLEVLAQAARFEWARARDLNDAMMQ